MLCGQTILLLWKRAIVWSEGSVRPRAEPGTHDFMGAGCVICTDNSILKFLSTLFLKGGRDGRLEIYYNKQIIIDRNHWGIIRVNPARHVVYFPHSTILSHPLLVISYLYHNFIPHTFTLHLCICYVMVFQNHLSRTKLKKL